MEKLNWGGVLPNFFKAVKYPKFVLGKVKKNYSEKYLKNKILRYDALITCTNQLPRNKISKVCHLFPLNSIKKN